MAAAGVWIAYYTQPPITTATQRTLGPHPIALAVFSAELNALRYAAQHSTTERLVQVRQVRFGEEIDTPPAPPKDKPKTTTLKVKSPKPTPEAKLALGA